MKINKFSFKDNAYEWSLEEISFDSLTLLVGASGVGKTQILKALYSLKQIANGESESGVKWSIEFETIKGASYTWNGEFEKKGIQNFIFDELSDDSNKNKPTILKENILKDGKEIIKRTKSGTFFKGQKTLKLSPQQSILYILKEEDLITPASQAFRRLIFSDQTESQNQAFRIPIFNVTKLERKYRLLKDIQESDEDIRVKLYLVSKVDEPTFDKIKERFCEIFPQVEGLKIKPLEFEDDELPLMIRDYPFIQIKETGVEKWIQQGRISSGMFRTLIHISEIYLCAKGTAFLIDEFENSLGINCINELTSDILKSNRELQFIVTSHHPYIINDIDPSRWKLVTRKSGVVKAHNVEKFNIGKSKHDAFMQLIQLEEYQTGLEQ